MNFVYIIKSQSKDKYYIGSCKDIAERLGRHNSGRNVSTKSGIPWTLVYSEIFETRKEAIKRENQIKSYKGGNAFKNLFRK